MNPRVFEQIQLCALGFLVSLNGPCGTSEVARPSKMSFGLMYVPSSGSFGTLPMGLEFTKFATSNKYVYSSKR